MDLIRSYRSLLLLFLLAFSAINCKMEKPSKDPKQGEEEGNKPKRKPFHATINLSTGEKKLTYLEGGDDHDDKTKSVLPVSNQEDSISVENIKLSHSDLKEALKNIKSNEGVTNAKAEHAHTFRNYEELKRELGDINLNPKTDAELLHNLISKFKKLMNAKEIDSLHVVKVIEDIDFLVHQIDNAIEFVRLGGFEDIIYKNFNSSIIQIKSECLRLLGSLVQNNFKVQKHAFETGALNLLLRTLVLQPDNAIKSRAVFALGGLLRHFPLAQSKFVESAGLIVFSELMSNNNDLKLQLKIVTLINDLVLEQVEAVDDHSNFNKTAQYKQIGLKQKLSELDWCKYLTVLFKNVYEVDDNDHDGFDKSLSAIISVLVHCNTSHLNNIQYILEDLYRRYTTLAMDAETVDGDYYAHMTNLCFDIMNYYTIVKKFKTEL